MALASIDRILSATIESPVDSWDAWSGMMLSLWLMLNYSSLPGTVVTATAVPPISMMMMMNECALTWRES